MKQIIIAVVALSVLFVVAGDICSAQYLEQEISPFVGIRGKGAYTIPRNTLSFDFHVEALSWQYTYDPNLVPTSGDEYRYRYHRMEIRPTLYYGITDR
ncbi:MAG: hypothetical protein QGH40_14925, partial [bacterium]|nr:hypothetical protein [bacterium]